MGRILAPHGVRGWIKVQPVSEAPEALLDYATWWMRPAHDSAWREVRKTAGRMHSGVLLVALAGVASREDALAHWCQTRQIKARALALVGYEDEDD